jgi:hypothetical protein
MLSQREIGQAYLLVFDVSQRWIWLQFNNLKVSNFFKIFSDMSADVRLDIFTGVRYF